MKRPDVTAEHAYVDDKRVVGLKIQTETYELDLLLTDDDLAILACDALPTVPDQRSLIAGTCLGMPAHWSKDDRGILGIVVGQDDETWEFGVWMPQDTFSEIMSRIRELRD